MLQCDEWPTWTAIYRVSGSEKELIGGYDQLSEVLLDQAPST